MPVPPAPDFLNPSSGRAAPIGASYQGQPGRNDVSTSHQYLSSSDLKKIKRVLADARLSVRVDEAARFLMRKYQEGVTEEVALAEALDRYIEQRSGWRLMQGGKRDRAAAERARKITAGARPSEPRHEESSLAMGA
ncbi:hypothetical protein C7I85_25235 [Mesorhizobium soli]|uniref:Uncharacterized protein n=1 Tax=Pseudaminobacter soli (ex Li et al. 2025) TaxID=1295366 RepID=A0A2P7S1G8_9HYPH|nr:hypothetical protein C7I85_25235 [Mesorhizobium soli]